MAHSRRKRLLPPLWTFTQAVSQLFKDLRRKHHVYTPPLRACRFLLEELEDRTAPSATPFGSEFLVNSYTQGNQQTFVPGDPAHSVISQSVAMDSKDGSYVVTWASQGQNANSGWDVYARRYNAAGTPLGSPFLVNKTTTNDQLDPNVAMAADGSFVITWQSHQGNNWAIYAQLYNSSGGAQGSNFLVSSSPTTDQINPVVSMDSSGNYVILWSSQNQQSQGGGWNVDARLYNAHGQAQSSQPLVLGATNNPANVSVALRSDGTFVVAGGVDGQGGGNSGTEYAGIFSSTGQLQGSMIVVGTTANNNSSTPSVAAAANGNFVVTWDSNDNKGDVEARLYDASGSPLGAAFQVNSPSNNHTQSPMAAMSPNGSFVITWSSQHQDAGPNPSPLPSIGWDINAQLYDATGTAQGGNFLVNTFLKNDQQYSSAAMSDKGLVIVWSSNSQGGPGSGWDVYGQQYSLIGISVTPTTGLTTTTVGGTATFSVVLNSQPTSVVTIGLSSSNTNEGTLSTSTLTFDPTDWYTPQIVTITGQNDTSGMDVPYTISFAAAQSNDSTYKGLVAPSVSVTNDYVSVPSPGITVTPLTPEVTTEAGGTAQFAVVLTSAPAGSDTVTIPISSSDTTTGTVDQSSLTFDASDWNLPQIVTVTGVNDYIASGDRTFSVLVGSASSDDPSSAYNGVAASPGSLTFTDLEEDRAGVIVTPLTALTTTESGGQAQFSVVLTSKPAGADTVTIPISSSDTTAGAVDKSSLTFDPTDWNTPQIVTVTGADDQVQTPDRTYTISIGAAQSSDSYYNGQFASTLTLTDQETDTLAPAAVTSAAASVTNTVSSVTNIVSSTTSTGSSAVPASAPSSTPADATSLIQQVALQLQTTTSSATVSTGLSSTTVALAGSGSGNSNPGAMTLARLISASQALSSTPSGGGGGGSAGSHPQQNPSREAKATVPAPDPNSNLTRVVVSATTAALPALPPAPASTSTMVPTPAGPLATPTVSKPVKLDFLQAQIDGKPIEAEPASRWEKATQVVFSTGMAASVGYVVFSGRGGAWLLSALTARPLWKQLDPLEVLFAWEMEKKRLGLDADEETLQSLVE